MSVDPYNRDPYTTVLDDDDPGVIWEYHARDRERADRLRAASAQIDIERVRPAVRNDDAAVAPMCGLLIGLAFGFVFWAVFLAGVYVVTA